MSDFILQMGFGGLLLEGGDRGWFQLLVLVVMAVLYGLASIVKARKRKLDVEEEEQPAHKPAPAGRGAQQLAARQTQQAVRPEPAREVRREPQPRPHPRPTAVRPRSALEAFIAEIKRAAQGDIFQPAEEPKLPPAPPTVQAQPQEPPAFTAKPLPSALSKSLALGAKQPADVDYLSKILPDLSGPDDLKKGILYYEILGKAVSLRGPSDHLIGL
ncbi:MAG: hypothetical protein KAY65_05745 [Planctomycetes bacterium]|nr:hypothetical protein [Planctomycetota bacterium]